MSNFVKRHKTGLVIVAIIVAMALLFTVVSIYTNNSALRMEEQISESKSGIDVQLKARNDKIIEIVQVVEQYSKHEKNIVESVTQARSKLSAGNTADAMKILNIVVENYPQIKANTSYENLEKEISISENLINNYRENYNYQVKSYRQFVRTFPNRWFLSIGGYQDIKIDYINFDQQELEVNKNMFKDADK
jgi:LemA protein